MPKTTTGRAASEQAATTMNLDLDRVTQASQTSLLAMAHLNARAVRNALEVNAELLDFARRRIGEEIGANAELSRCTSLTDAMEVMSGFYQRAFSQYAEEADRLVKLGADATRRSIEETQAESEEIART